MSTFLPVEKEIENDQVVAFVHPHPAYRIHYLILPKKPLHTLMDLSAADGDLLVAVTQAVQELVRRLGLADKGYRLIVNGGSNQKIKQLHFHLIAD